MNYEAAGKEETKHALGSDRPGVQILTLLFMSWCPQGSSLTSVSLLLHL